MTQVATVLSVGCIKLSLMEIGTEVIGEPGGLI